MIPRRRESSKWIFSKELKDTTFVEELPENEKGKPFIVTPLGTRVKRILIAGIVTSKNTEENFTKLTVADALGSFYVTAFTSEYQPEVKEKADSLEINGKALIMGRVNTFKTDDGVLYVNINPEMILTIDGVALNYWFSRTRRIATRKIIAIKELLKLEKPEKSSLISMGYTDEESDCAMRYLEHYRTYDVQSMLESVSSSSKVAETNREEASMKDEILDFIRKNADPQKGCRYEDIVAHMKEKNSEQDKTDEILNLLGSEGEIYEIALKRYKAI